MGYDSDTDTNTFFSKPIGGDGDSLGLFPRRRSIVSLDGRTFGNESSDDGSSSDEKPWFLSRLSVGGSIVGQKSRRKSLGQHIYSASGGEMGALFRSLVRSMGVRNF